MNKIDYNQPENSFLLRMKMFMFYHDVKSVREVHTKTQKGVSCFEKIGMQASKNCWVVDTHTQKIIFYFSPLLNEVTPISSSLEQVVSTLR